MSYYNPPMPDVAFMIRTGHLCPCRHADVMHSPHLGCFVLGCPCKDGTRSLHRETPSEQAWRLATIADEADKEHAKSLDRLKASMAKRSENS